MQKLVQNGSSNGAPDAAIEGALDGGLTSLWKQLKIHEKMTKSMHLMFYLT